MPLSVSLRSRIQSRQTVFGAFIELPCPEAVEIAALAGWDFVVVDSEHGAITPSAYPAFVRAGECREMPVVFRVAENNAALIQQALDAGCDDYDTKPIEFPRLLAKIEALLKPEAQA